jgi:hypothetical protein
MTEKISIEVEGKRISGRHVVRDGMVTCWTHNNGRNHRKHAQPGDTRKETLLLQSHRNGERHDVFITVAARLASSLQPRCSGNSRNRAVASALSTWRALSHLKNVSREP